MNKYQEALDVIKKINLRSEHYVQFEEDNIKNVYEEEINIIQKLVDKEKPMLLKWEDIGYDLYNNANVYGCICPRCNLILMSATDNEIEVEDPYPKDIRKAFLDVFSPNGNKQGLNNYCNRCGQKLDWSDEE